MRILVIRRDNIGDLVCTTPLLATLRAAFPGAWIAVLANSYNAAVLEGNPDVSEVLTYTKLKHVKTALALLPALARRLTGLFRLRRQKLDVVILATTDFSARTARLAALLAPGEIVGYSDGSPRAALLRRSLPLSDGEPRHEVERVHALAALVGAEGRAIPPVRVHASAAQVQRARARLPLPATAARTVAIHLSARRAAQQWPASSFSRLIELLLEVPGLSVVVLWSPGPASHPRHPGDDAKAAEVLREFRGCDRVVAYPTDHLEQLIGMLGACDIVVCADGGASHLAAALGKPVVCLFGDSDVRRWRPWGVPQRVLQPPTRKVSDIPPEDVAAALKSLAEEQWGTLAPRP